MHDTSKSSRISGSHAAAMLRLLCLGRQYSDGAGAECKIKKTLRLYIIY